MVRCTLKELEQLKERIFDTALKPDELVRLRGERPDATATAVGKDAAESELMVEDPSENPCIEEDILVEYCPDGISADVRLMGWRAPERKEQRRRRQQQQQQQGQPQQETESSSPSPSSSSLSIQHATPEDNDQEAEDNHDDDDVNDDDDVSASSAAVIEAFGGNLPSDDDLDENDGNHDEDEEANKD